MIRLRLLLMSLLVLFAATNAKSQFDRFFKDSTFRFDYYHSGTKGEERFTSDKMYEEGEWPGSTTQLLDTLNLGEYCFEVVDYRSDKVLYSRGFSSLFHEWQTTDEALAGVWRTFHETVRFPFPKGKVQLRIFGRNKEMAFDELFSAVIDPNGEEVRREASRREAKVDDIEVHGDSHSKVDIVILGDGYSAADMPKFRADAKHFTNVLLGTEPFKSRKKEFNVRAIEVVSRRSGINQPDRGIWTGNALGTSYNSFGSARYVLSDDNAEIRDYAALAPYDFMFILVNVGRYGGGGIFQLYATCYATGETPETAWQADYVFVHEFGHCFAGLGDEYYSSSVAYNDFYPKGVEPWEPNIAVDVSRTGLKWAGLVDAKTPLPTPWNKQLYDSMEAARGNLRREETGYAEKRQMILDAEHRALTVDSLKGVVGAFEGAGYSSKGFYRPSLDCRMFSLSLVDFDPVCAGAINRMIDFYSK